MFSLSVLLILCEFHAIHSNPIHLSLSCTCPLPLQPPPKREKRKNYLFWKLQCVTMCPLLSILLVNVHCNDSLIWYKASGSARTSLGLLLDILLFLCFLRSVGPALSQRPGSGCESYLSWSAHRLSCTYINGEIVLVSFM